MTPQTSIYSQTTQSLTKPYSQKSHEPSSYRAFSRSWSLCQLPKLQTELPSCVLGSRDWSPDSDKSRPAVLCLWEISAPVEIWNGVDGFGTVLPSGKFWDDVQTVGCSYVTEVVQGTDPTIAGEVLAGFESLYRLRPDIYQDEIQLENVVWRSAIADTEIDEDMYG
jgi:hypothetical protein